MTTMLKFEKRRRPALPEPVVHHHMQRQGWSTTICLTPTQVYIKARFSFVYLFVGNCKLKITTQIARDSPTCAGNTQVPAASRTRRKAMTVRKTIHQPFLGIVAHRKRPTPTSLEPEPHHLHPPRNFREATRYTNRFCIF